MKRLMIFAVSALTMIGAFAQDNFTGVWHGELTVGPQRLPLVFRIDRSDAGYTATMDSPSQGAKDIKCDTKVIGDTIDLSIPMILASYRGVYADGQIKGKFTQHGMKFDLNLEPGEYIPPRPQTPQPPYPYRTQEVRILNHVDSAVLAGTITYPVNYDASKCYPLVVMVTGSGQQNRDEELFGHKPFAVLADYLAKNGIMSLRYDDRGFGESTGNVANATSATFATDAKAVTEWVRKNLDCVDKVGILGHSEGGEIAFMLAAEDVPDFIVSLAGPTLRGDEILMMQNSALLGHSPMASQYLEGLRKVFDFMIANPGVREWSALNDVTAGMTLVPPQMKQNLQDVIASRNPWMDYFIAYDPSDSVAKTKVPVLALNGQLDMQVPANENLETLRKLLPENPKNVVKEYPSLNHLFQHCTTGQPAEYMQIEETMSSEVLSDIASWINGL